MIDPIEYINAKLLSIIFVLAQNIINHFLILNVQFVLMGIKMPKKKTILCATWFSILYLAPIYLVDFFSYPSADLRTWIYSLLIFITPPAALIGYFATKHTLKISPAKSSIVLHNELLIHYIVVLLYMIINDTFVALFGSTAILVGILYIGDIVGIFLIISILIVLYLSTKALTDKTKKHLLIPPNYSDKNVKTNIIRTFTAISIIYTAVVFFRIFWLASNRSSITLTTGFIYALLIVGILLYLLNTISRFRIKLLEWELQSTGTYISSLLHVNQEFRGIKHDFYNVLQVYSGYLSTENYDGLKKYHQSLFHTTKLAGDFLSLIDVLKSRIAVYSLIEAKAQSADKCKVEFSVSSVCDVTNVVLTDLDLCRILSIVFDNAIEAASDSIEKQVNISFQRKDENTIVFIVSNTTKGDVDVNLIFNEGYTSKENHMGIGLSHVTRILNTYDHCIARVNYHENQFSMFLILSANGNVK